MKQNSKRVVSRVLSFIMIISAMMTNIIMADSGLGSVDSSDVASGGGVESGSSVEVSKIDVWDFGGVEESDANLYVNHITRDFLDNFTAVGDEASGSKGKFMGGGTFDLGGGMSLSSNNNDRLFYNGADGKRSYGTNAKAESAYADGYTANGMWYANGTGGDNRRLFQFDNVKAGTEIKVYTGCSNAKDNMVEFTAINGTQKEEIVLAGGDVGIAKFIAKEDGSYKVWFSAAGGKPIVNRIVKTSPVPVTITVNSNEFGIQSCDVVLTNDVTGDKVEGSTGTAINLTPGYSYTASAKGIVGYGFTGATKVVNVTTDDILAGSKKVAMDIESKQTYKATGKLTGFDAGYDVSKLVLTLTPDAESLADTVKAVVNADLTFEASLEPDVKYTASLEGVNDYEIISGGVFEGSKDIMQDINVAMKAVYKATGKLAGGAAVKEVAFVNVDDGYSYAGIVDGDTYTVMLRAGSYEVKAVADGYKTSSHVVVEDKDVTKDILFVPVTAVPPTVDTSVKDIYVGCEGQVNNFATMKEALSAAAVMNPQSEADRVTIHIAPGTYREQITVATPYVTFKPEGNGEVKLTWYYGVGYNYYSINSGYYDEERAFDKYSKGTPDKWGVGTYIKGTGFRAEGITFEASFNKYITDEEIADGAEAIGDALPARTYALDPASKTATERSTAVCIDDGVNAEFSGCSFIGSQDTLYIGSKMDSTKGVLLSHAYFKNCMIEGNTDYIFGSGNAVFDGCELRFCGYSDTGVGGYITAGRGNKVDGYMGYLFRACTITNKEGMQHASGFFGRPWDADSDITFLNTTLEKADAIDAKGWTSMSGVEPTAAKFKEYGTINADGTPADTASRVTGVMTDEEAKTINAKEYFDDWTPVYYADDTLPVEFAKAPYLSTDGDVLLPQTGNTFTVKYSLGANDVNDASKITYALVGADGKETVIKNTTAQANKGVKLTADMIGSFLKITVTPCTILGNVGEAKSVVTEKEISLGSGTINPNRPSGKSVIFLAGDSTVKDYSAGAINNSGANRPEGSWGEFLGYFVNDGYEVMDYAQGGRSARGFMNGTKADGSDKYLDMIKEKMVEGDYLFIQFGHNDSSASYADRYVPVGTPDASGKYPYTPQTDTTDAGSGSFCWYLQQYVDAAKAVKATPVLVTPVSRMYFNADGTIKPHHGDNDEYVKATKQVAEDNGIVCFDLYEWTKKMYEDSYKVDGKDGNSDLAYRLFAPGEKTHHSKLGGFAIAADLAEMIQNSSLGFANAIIAPKSMYITNDKDMAEFVVNTSGVFTGYGRNDKGEFDTSVATPYWDEYINNSLKALVSEKPVETTTVATTEATTEATTAATTETPTEATTTVIPPEDKYIGIEPVVVSNENGKLVVDYNIVNTTGKGFNNYTMFITFDPSVLTPVSAADGEIAIDAKDAAGAPIKVYASNAGKIQAQFADVPASGNKDFADADGVKTQAQLGRVKISYCIFDKDFSQAGSGSLPSFTSSGRLFTVTYDVKGSLAGKELASDIKVINAVSTDLDIVFTPDTVKSFTYKFGSETTTETTTEATTIKPTEPTTEATTDKPTEATTAKPTEPTTEATTDKPTEATTAAPVTQATTEAPTEATTAKPHYSSGGGAGASSIKVKGYTSTTQATTEAVTEAVTESATEAVSKADSSGDAELPYVKVVIDSKDIVVGENTYTMDVAPYIQAASNSTMVPLRFVAIAIAGGDVEKADTSDMVVWDAVAKTATIVKGDVKAVFTAGSNIVNINGAEAPMNYGVVAEIKNSRMFVPFRVIGEALKASVDWDSTEKAAFYNK